MCSKGGVIDQMIAVRQWRQSCQIARLSDCKIVRLADCQIVRLSDCKIGNDRLDKKSNRVEKSEHSTAFSRQANVDTVMTYPIIRIVHRKSV